MERRNWARARHRTTSAAFAAGLVVLLLGTACGGSSTSPPREVLDQENLLEGALGGQAIGRFDQGSGDPDPSGADFDYQDGQTFTAGVSGTLTRVKLPLRNLFAATDPVVLEIREVAQLGVPDTSDAGLLGTASLAASEFDSVVTGDPSTWPSFDISSQGIHVVEGHVYALTVQTISPESFIYNTENTMMYGGGEGYRRNRALGKAWPSVSYEFGFQTFVEGS